MPTMKFSQEELLDAVNASLGIMSNVARTLKCDWRTAQKYVYRWRETRKAWEEQRNKQRAMVIGQYLKALNSGERWAIERGLDTIAKDEGLSSTPKLEISTPQGRPLETRNLTAGISEEVFRQAVDKLAALKAPDPGGPPEELLDQ